MNAPNRAALEHLLGPQGPVAAALGGSGGGWEERPQQGEMADAVARALSSGRHLLVEAGTGVGKSFAYLVPLLARAAETRAVAAVATSTIALQEQLVRKDLPLLAKTLPFEVTFSLVKGRGNYLCLRRLHRALAEAPGLLGEDEALQQLAAIRASADQSVGEGSLRISRSGRGRRSGTSCGPSRGTARAARARTTGPVPTSARGAEPTRPAASC